jgi:DNA excision repair protein ERCC-4
MTPTWTAPKRPPQIDTPGAQPAAAVSLPEMPKLRTATGSVLPTVICDTREKLPLPITGLRVIRATLVTGDYSYHSGEEVFSLERKSLDDLAQSLTRDRQRFTRELQRLRAYDFRRVIVIGTRGDIEAHRYRPDVSPKAILSSIAALEVRYSTPFVFCPSPEEAAAQVEQWVCWHARETILRANSLTRGPAAEASETESAPAVESTLTE